MMICICVVSINIAATSGKKASTSTAVSTTSALVTSTTTIAWPNETQPTLVIWGKFETEALLTNINGDVKNLAWGNEGDVDGYSLCKLVHQNQFYLLGHGISYLCDIER